MDFADLRYFCEVVRQGNVTRAAETAGIAQPALTRRIRLLEQELGAQLLLRLQRGVQPTEAGLVFAARAELLLRLANEVRDEVHLLASEPSGQVRFSFPPSLANLFLTGLIADYLRRYPRVTLHLDEHFTPQVRENLLAGVIDIGIMSADAGHSDLLSLPLFAERLWLVSRAADWPFGDTPILPVDSVEGRPILIASRLRMALVGVEGLDASKVVARVEADALTTLRESVRAGLGFLLGPPSTVTQELDSGEFRGAPVMRLHVTRALYRRRDRPMTKALQEFEAAITASAEELLRARPEMLQAIAAA